MGKDKTLKYRIVCPYSNKGFDSRSGRLYIGQVICNDCYNKIPYATLNDYKK
jgi:hypothetical protein